MAKKKSELENLKNDFPKSKFIEKIDEFIELLENENIDDIDFTESNNYLIGNLIFKKNHLIFNIIENLISKEYTSKDNKLSVGDKLYWANEYNMKFGGNVKYLVFESKNFKYIIFLKHYDDMITELHIRQFWDKLDLLDYENPYIEELAYNIEELSKNQNNESVLLKISNLMKLFSDKDKKKTLDEIMKSSKIGFNSDDDSYIISIISEKWYPSAIKIENIKNIKFVFDTIQEIENIN